MAGSAGTARQAALAPASHGASRRLGPSRAVRTRLGDSGGGDRASLILSLAVTVANGPEPSRSHRDWHWHTSTSMPDAVTAGVTGTVLVPGNRPGPEPGGITGRGSLRVTVTQASMITGKMASLASC